MLKEVFIEAKKIVEQGWCQNSWAQNKVGDPVLVHSPNACSWCMGGAIRVAIKRLKYPTSYSKVENLFKQKFGVSFPSFNDQSTKEEVLKALEDLINETNS